jgi:hypothetical protein
MEKESLTKKVLRENYGITDVANTNYIRGDYLDKIRKEYDNMLDNLLEYNFGKDKN